MPICVPSPASRLPTVAVNVCWASPRRTVSAIFAPGWALTIRWMSTKVGVGHAVDRLDPVGVLQPRGGGGRARLHLGHHRQHQRLARRSRTARRTAPAASRKLAIGPAATTIARDRISLSWKVRPGIQPARVSSETVFRPFLPVQLDVAAKRQPGELPGRADAVLSRLASAWPKPIENTSTWTPRQRAASVVAEFVHENQHAQHHHEGEAGLQKAGQGVEQVRGPSGGASSGELGGGAAGGRVKGNHIVERVGRRHTHGV